MSRRFLFPLATGVVCLVAMSPVLAAEQSAPAANKSPAKATTTTAPADDSGANPGTDSGSTTDTTEEGTSGTSGTTGTTGKGSTATTGKSAPAPGGGQRSTSVCDQPDTNQEPAPQMGDGSQSHDAGEAGTVEVERLSESELRVVKATANDGWTEQVANPSGPRVTVKFTRQGQSPSLIRFAASMDEKGTMIHTRVTSCG